LSGKATTSSGVLRNRCLFTFNIISTSTIPYPSNDHFGARRSFKVPKSHSK
jgi:hypothetical protein